MAMAKGALSDLLGGGAPPAEPDERTLLAERMMAAIKASDAAALADALDELAATPRGGMAESDEE